MNDCIKAEMEYREWRECPLWYSVKTLLRADGKMESEIVSDEKTPSSARPRRRGCRYPARPGPTT